MPGANQALLVGERHLAAKFDGCMGGPDTGGARDSGDHDVRGALRCLDDGFLAGAGRDSSPCQCITQRRKAIRIGKSREASAQADRRRGERLDVTPTRHRLDPEGSPLRLQNLHGGASDRTCGSKQRNGCRHGQPGPPVA